MRPSRVRDTSLACCIAVLSCAGQALAQDTPIHSNPPSSALVTNDQSASSSVAPAPARVPGLSQLFSPLAGDAKRMFREHNLLLVGIGAAGAMSAHNWDADVARSGWGRGSVHEALEPGQMVGNFLMQTGGSLATYSIGRATHNERVATIGAELFRAGLIAQGTTQLIKVTTSRTRPDGTSHSFPSGHTAAAFASASVLSAELGWKVGVPAYAMATWVAASRVQMERHYLSDVIAGATIGILAGRSVTVGRGAARFSVSPMAVPGGVGASFVHVSSR